ncbi:uncharacterized protein ASPGLDRAFT_1516534 [Aspergillus glaucus CBS 516.65]|uniref:Bul1 C-terminal domain-containing protein n=1 Tax=Aspergillus glaucus CBS 516.65 TaxID=1160497 RepID=A0A1L9VL06_ASPGL|nr:hypothetical protein ASPGLDRAFT_1516534 [Aspergillus glaucus CBS 516.65]OJJ84618.1 hypothetical protein ASPGLDRAFT_1516534 [Aspergillus glaucus CBS 516.65]
MFNKPCADVQLLTDSQRSYGIHDRIEGTISFTPQQLLAPDQLNLSFKGTTTVSMDTNETNIPLPPSAASQTFLRMQQPLTELPHSKPASLEIGTTYLLPFDFIVPAEIPHNVCRHSHRHEQVHWEHCQLPLSMGQRSIRQLKDSIVDDMAPEGIDITYSICLRVFESCRKTGIIRTIAEWRHPVHIRSSRKERPPLLIPWESRYYCLSKEKKVIGGWCPRELGTLSVKTAQPAAVQSHRQFGLLTTTITANLQYTTSARSPPPELQSTHPQLNILTFSSLEPWPDFPDLIDSSMYPYHNRLNMRMMPLQPCQLGALEWQTSISEKDLRQESTTYTASVQVSVILPDKTAYIPTFLSCLVARIYSMKLSFLYRVEGQWGKTSKITVTVPVQIC